jgi:hypothetical protein
METTIVTSKQVRQRLGSVILDLKYIKDKVFLIEKKGEEDFVGVIMSAGLARENGIDIPEKGKSETKPESKPDQKKKK